MELYDASRQWASRPDDERFATVNDLYEATWTYANRSSEQTARFNNLRVRAYKDDIRIVTPNLVPVEFTHFSFGQFCQRLGAPAAFLSELPSNLISDILNCKMDGLEDADEDVKCLLQAQMSDFGEGVISADKILLRAATSQIYERIWNHEVVSMVQELPNWRVPPARPCRGDQKGTRPATAEDVLNSGRFGLSVNIGDLVAPAGLYASDHDCFIFMVDDSKPIISGSETLFRGAFFKNSEVGRASLKICVFLYEGVCGNHIVWGAQNVTEFSIRHVGKQAREHFFDAVEVVKKYMETSPAEDVAEIKRAKTTAIGDDRKEVVNVLFNRRLLTRTDADKAFDYAETNEDTHGDPTTVWGMVSGVTRLSQETPFADKREELDRAAQRILKSVF